MTTEQTETEQAIYEHHEEEHEISHSLLVIAGIILVLLIVLPSICGAGLGKPKRD
jgi:hypothetical protein